MTPHKEILRFYTAILIRDRARRVAATGIAIWPALSAQTLPTYVVSAELNDSLLGKENSRVQMFRRNRMHASNWMKNPYQQVNMSADSTMHEMVYKGLGKLRGMG